MKFRPFVMACLLALLVGTPALSDNHCPDGATHCAEDGSYRLDGYWIDGCGEKHKLCPECTCPDAQDVECEFNVACPDMDLTDIERAIDSVMNNLASMDGKQSQANASLKTTLNTIMNNLGNPVIVEEEFYQSSFGFVIGANDASGWQARWNWFGLRYLDFDGDDHWTESSLRNAGFWDTDADYIQMNSGKPAYVADPSWYDYVGEKRTGDARSLEVIGYIPVYDLTKDECVDWMDYTRIVCRFSPYVGVGIHEYETIEVYQNIMDSLYVTGETDDRYDPVFTGGLQYHQPIFRNFGLSAGAGWSSEAGATASINFSYLAGRKRAIY